MHQKLKIVNTNNNLSPNDSLNHDFLEEDKRSGSNSCLSFEDPGFEVRDKSVTMTKKVSKRLEEVIMETSGFAAS